MCGRTLSRLATVGFLLMAAGVSAQCGPSGCYAPPRVAATPEAAPLPSAVRRAVQSAVRIVHEEGSGSSLGSGAIVRTTEDGSWILTCAHLFTQRGRTRVLVGGQAYGGRVVAIDRRHDLALLKTPPLPTPPVVVAETPERAELVACGFGSSGALRAIHGVITGRAVAQGAESPSVRIRGAVRSGDSGGPVFDLSGRLVAVVWGQRGGETYAMGGGPLQRILAKLPSRRRSLPPVQRSPREPDPWRERVEQRLDELAKPRPTNPRRLPDDVARRSDLSDLSASWDQRLERLRAEVNADAPAAPSSTTSVLADLRRSGVSEAVLALAAGALPTAAVVFAWRAWRRRQAPRPRRESAVNVSRRDTQPVAIDTPPPPQQVVPETHYVPYEQDAFAKAHQWASEQLVRKFPGSVEMLSSLDALIKQQLNGKES